MGPKLQSALIFLALWFVGYLTVCVCFSVVIGGILAAAEGVSFSDEAFPHCLAEITDTDIEITEWEGPEGVAGKILSNILCLLKLVLIAIFIGMSAGPPLDPFLEPMRLLATTRKDCLWKNALFCAVGMPILFAMVAIGVGGVFAAVEGCEFGHGHNKILGKAMDTETLLGPDDCEPPETAGGKFMAVLASVGACAILGIVIAIVSIPLLGIELNFSKSPVLWYLLNSEQKEEVRKQRGEGHGAKVQPQ